MIGKKLNESFTVGSLFSVGYSKKIFRISRILKKTIPGNTFLIYSTKHLFTEIRSLKKSSCLKDLKNIYCTQTVIFDLCVISIPENSRIWVIWAIKRKAIHCAPKNTFLRKVDTNSKLPCQISFVKRCRSQSLVFDLSKSGIIFEKVSFWNCDFVPAKLAFSKTTESELFVP